MKNTFEEDLLDGEKLTDLKGHLLTFCQTTSIKGMARLTRSDRFSILWLIAVVLFLGISALMVYNLVSEFSNHSRVINLNEGVVSATDPILPPQVTVCNLNPFTGTAQEDALRQGIPIISDFIDYLNKLRICPSCSAFEQSARDASSVYLQYTGGYYQFIGKDASIKLSHKKEIFIVECRTLALFGFRLQDDDCAKVVTVSLISTADDFNCFQFHINTTANPDRFFLGLSLTFYLDNFQSMEYPTQFTIGESLGVKVSVDAPGTVPFNAIETLYIPPGKWSHVQVAQETRHRLEQPYGECNTQTELGVYQSTGETKIYTMHSCTSLCVEKMVLDYCDCLDANMLNLLHEIEPSSTREKRYCEDINVQGNAFMNNTNCARHYRQEGFKQCAGNCTFPCHETIYKTSMSQSLWPRENDMAGFRAAYIQDKPFEYRFNDVVEGEHRSQTDLIQENFLRLSVYHGDYRFNILNESAALSQSGFLSQLGGALNLWSGITSIVIIELLDLCYQILMDKMFPPPIMSSHSITVS